MTILSPVYPRVMLLFCETFTKIIKLIDPYTSKSRTICHFAHSHFSPFDHLTNAIFLF